MNLQCRVTTRPKRAWAEGKYDQDIVPIKTEVKGKEVIFDHDETYRKGATVEKGFAKLKPIFQEGGSVTAANASPINDGSCVMLMMSAEKRKNWDTSPLEIHRGRLNCTLDPSIMGYAPVSAVEKLEKKTGISRYDVGLYELNEAFAAQAAACVQDLKLDPEIVNVNGGAGLRTMQ